MSPARWRTRHAARGLMPPSRGTARQRFSPGTLRCSPSRSGYGNPAQGTDDNELFRRDMWRGCDAESCSPVASAHSARTSNCGHSKPRDARWSVGRRRACHQSEACCRPVSGPRRLPRIRPVTISKACKIATSCMSPPRPCTRRNHLVDPITTHTHTSKLIPPASEWTRYQTRAHSSPR